MDEASPDWPVASDVARQQVRYVVESIVRTDELEVCDLLWLRQGQIPNGDWFSGLSRGPEEDTATLILWVTVVARGERYSFAVWQPGLAWSVQLAELGDGLQEWVCETEFAWGELRPFALPPA